MQKCITQILFMKNMFLAMVLFLMVFVLSAQVPQNLNYQAIARNAYGIALSNQHIGLRFSIHDGLPTGVIVYQESDTATTNQFGLFSMLIGTGTVISGTFTGINWATGNKYLQVEIDSGGGNNYIEMGTTQLASVPYALYAKTSGNTGNNGFTHYLGEVYGGGVVFHVFQDSTGQTHGLIVSLDELGADTAAWVSASYDWSVPNALSNWNGASNCDSIIAYANGNFTLAQLCRNYNGGGYNDWFLPAIYQLTLVFTNLYNVNKTLSKIGSPIETQGGYWSSTMVGPTNALYYNWGISYSATNIQRLARAVRTF